MKTFLAALFMMQAAGDPNGPAFAPVTDDPKLPRILLIGDSISIDYTVPVRKRMTGEANVHRIPENGGPTTNGLARIDGWLETGRWDVIHFNWGLHDLKLVDGKPQVELADYEKNLRELVKKLEATGANLVWATTTPVPPGKVDPPRNPEDVPRYNDAAKKVMEEAGITIDDLYAFALPRLKEIQKPANVHYTPEGSDALAGPVADALRHALAKRK